MSFFAAPLNCRSIILETERPEIVSAIGFMPRNDDNFVWEGHLSLPWALSSISNEKLVISNLGKSSTISNSGRSELNKLQLLITNYKLLIAKGSFLITNCALVVVGLDTVLLTASMSRTAWCAAVVGSIIALFGNKVILFGSRLKDVCTWRQTISNEQLVINNSLPAAKNHCCLISLHP